MTQLYYELGVLGSDVIGLYENLGVGQALTTQRCAGEPPHNVSVPAM